jgi:lysophospholipase L1-like esterase
MSTSITPSASFMHLSDTDFLAKLGAHSKFKDRSYKTQYFIHLPELNYRLNLNVELPTPSSSDGVEDDPFAAKPDLQNKVKIEVICLGNSMFERLKNTGLFTNLGQLSAKGCAWNAGVGGDMISNNLYRLSNGLYTILKEAQQQNLNTDDVLTKNKAETNTNIKLWILASGTNDLTKKRSLRPKELEAYRLLLEACLRISPKSKVLVCDMFYRKDISDAIVDMGNEMLEQVVRDVNQELVKEGDEDRVIRVEARQLIGKDRLVDHVHLDERGYGIWDELLWPLVSETLGKEELVDL